MDDFSFHQAEISANVQVRNVYEAKIAAGKLRTLGCMIPIITLGSEGVVFMLKDEEVPIHVPTKQVEALDTTVREIIANFYYSRNYGYYTEKEIKYFREQEMLLSEH